MEKNKILQRLILKYSSSTNCLITKVHSYNLDPIKLLNAKTSFQKNVEIGVQEIMKSAIIPLKSSKIIRVKVWWTGKEKQRVILNLSSSKSLMFSCYIYIYTFSNISKL